MHTYPPYQMRWQNLIRMRSSTSLAIPWVELWQSLEPDEVRISDNICKFHSAAVSCAAVYAGWSYEPRGPVTNDS